ncbi:MAG: SDR family oxidoreductase [Sphingomonadales bacterium]|nr:MAG: SDR family oxidoreductase [Sphingomonadales bacterium]
MVSDINEAAGRETLRAIGNDAHFVQADIRDPAAAAELVATAVRLWGRLDTACNNAGIEGNMALLIDQSDDDFTTIFDVNVRGVFNCLRAELRQMLEQGHGAIVNMASGAAQIGVPTMGLYAATKHAVVGLTRTAALEAAASGIRVNAMLPGMVDTPMTRERIYGGHPQGADILNFAPAGRPAKPEEIADSVAWMLSDRAAYMMGSSVVVDGGVLAGSPPALGPG